MLEIYYKIIEISSSELSPAITTRKIEYYSELSITSAILCTFSVIALKQSFMCSFSDYLQNDGKL